MQDFPEGYSTAGDLACVNCGALLSGVYCSRCGEKRLPPGSHTLKGILGDWLEAVSHGEGKLLKSLKLLISKPGFLTREYFLGRRVAYTRPAALFLAVNVLYFLLVTFDTFTTPLIVQVTNNAFGQAHIAQRLVTQAALGDSVSAAQQDAAMDAYIRLVLPGLTALNKTQAQAEFKRELAREPAANQIKALASYAGRFNSRTDVLARILVIALVPMLAICLWLVLAAFRQGLPKLVIFAAHFWTAMLLFFVVIGLLTMALGSLVLWLGHAPSFLTDINISLFIACVVVVFAYFSVRGFFRFSRFACGALALWMLLGVFMSIWLYRILLFYVTFVSLQI